MTIDELKTLIANDEHRQLELKKTTGELKDGMHSACAFLNTDGGWLVFGVAPTSLKVLGQQVNDNTQREIALALSHMEPQVDVRVEYIDVPGRDGDKVIAMHFNGWNPGMRPYTYHGCPYYKVESTTKEMPRDMFDTRLRQSNPDYFAWERQVASGVDVSQLDEKLIRGVIRLGVESGRIPDAALFAPVTEVLDKWRLMSADKPIHSAAILFSKNLHDYPQLCLRMARFRGTDKNEFIDNQRVEGNFFELLDAGMSFFRKHLNMSGVIRGWKREESLEVPAPALRETLINALCHRQWEYSNLTIGIAIYDDRIEIENPGMFPPSITPENIKQPHNSYPYNPIIAHVLYQTSYLESWGSGAKRIMDACMAHDVPEPEWRDQGGFVVVTFRRQTVTSQQNNGDRVNGTVNGTDDISELSERQKKIYQYIKDGTVNGTVNGTVKCNAQGLSDYLDIPLRTIKRDLYYLRDRGLIHFEGSDKTGQWKST